MCRPRLALAAALLVCLTATGAATPAIPRGVPTSKLALMPLPHSAYGSQAAALRLDTDESGAESNADAASDSTDKKDSAASLKAAGRLTGHGVVFADYNLFDKPGRLAYVSSSVELYTSAAQASAGVTRKLRDALLDDRANGFTLVSSSRFAAPGLGDRSAGLRAQFKLAARPVWFTGVLFQRGDLVVGISVLRTDGTDETEYALRLARAAESRVEGVLAGKITTAPVKLPAKATETAVKPAVKIDTGVLTRADLNGAKITRQEYVRDDDAVASYEREFDSVKYGGSRFLNVESDLTLYSTAAQASVFLTGIRSVFDPASSSFKSFVRNAFSDGRAA